MAHAQVHDRSGHRYCHINPNNDRPLADLDAVDVSEHYPTGHTQIHGQREMRRRAGSGGLPYLRGVGEGGQQAGEEADIEFHDGFPP